MEADFFSTFSRSFRDHQWKLAGPVILLSYKIGIGKHDKPWYRCFSPISALSYPYTAPRVENKEILL